MALDLVAPVIPDGNDSKGPELFMHSLGQGLQAVARLSQMRRDSEMEMLKLAEHERLAQEQNAIEKEKMANDFEIRQATLESTQKLNESHGLYYKEQAKAFANQTATAAQRATAFNQQRQELVNEVNQHADELRLNDPKFATKEPVQFAANVMKFESAWEQSPLPEVKHAIKTFRTLADQQKIPLRIGAQFDDSDLAKGPTWKGGVIRQVPVWQVIKNLNDPEQKDATIATLKASGHITDIQYQEPGDPDTLTPFQKAWNFLGGDIQGRKYAPTPKTVRKTELAPEIKSHVEKGQGVTFERVPSRVPPAMLPKSAAGGTTPTELPEPDLPPDTTGSEMVGEPQASASPKFDETKTDLYIRQAKDAIAQGASAAAIAQRLQEMSIDPSAIFDAAT